MPASCSGTIAPATRCRPTAAGRRRPARAPLARAEAPQLPWYDRAGDAVQADGSWAPMFEGMASEPAQGIISHAEAAAFAADPGRFRDERFASLRRPHMMLLLACVRLLRHGQDAINALADRHYEHQLRQVLHLAPAPAPIGR